ncbi:MAG: RdgB/HAM1 family non-canonical purine NTP pyrophosphatase [Oscillospiraceae bacterium]|jgi:XTP/dITP diphosphohydrolase|nr:RdgB/HAM1 family non-canonical purine NTP pyrophosphatase [Oscillospiraceae bacterium]
MKLIIATNNKHKVRELKSILAPRGYEAVSLADENISVEITEDGDTFEENARIKAEFVYGLTHTPVIADDSGLEVEFLGGAPGIYSARYGGEDLTDTDRNDLLLEELSGVEPELRGAKFVCAVYFIKDDEEQYCFTGELAGYIGTEPLGDGGFGYDPIFMLDEDTSLATLPEEEKNQLSHRAKALKQLEEELRKQ